MLYVFELKTRKCTTTAAIRLYTNVLTLSKFVLFTVFLTNVKIKDVLSTKAIRWPASLSDLPERVRKKERERTKKRGLWRERRNLSIGREKGEETGQGRKGRDFSSADITRHSEDNDNEDRRGTSAIRVLNIKY
eukprot:1343235-Amorphochlora_amoeboformis.AAC.1